MRHRPHFPSGGPLIGIDLFCGVGGLSLGFEQAGVEVVGAFDVDPLNVSAHARNFPGASTVRMDLTRARGADILRACRRKLGDVDVLFGGPPCQGFSFGGSRDMHDERNQLLLSFARLVTEIRPRYFVVENVAGLLVGGALALVDAFESRIRLGGYRLVKPVRVLDAHDFAVPQRRKRAFLLGYHKDAVPLDYPRPGDLAATAGPPPTVRDALRDLPDVDLHDELFLCDTYVGPMGVPSSYAATLRACRVDEEDRAGSRRRRPGALTGCLRTAHDPRIVRRFAATEPGGVDPTSRYIRLSWDGHAPTLRAGTGSDHGRHTAPRPIHPSKPRCITAREAARLHSFPDWFCFHPTRWNSFRQIGNSVPPRLARAVADALLDRVSAANDRRSREVRSRTGAS